MSTELDDYEYRCRGCGATADAPCEPGCPENPCEDCGGIDKHLEGCPFLTWTAELP